MVNRTASQDRAGLRCNALTRIGMDTHRVEPKLMSVGQEWYCGKCNRTVHKRADGSWRHNPESRR